MACHPASPPSLKSLPPEPVQEASVCALLRVRLVMIVWEGRYREQDADGRRLEDGKQDGRGGG